MVQTVCECIVIVRGIKEVSWKSAKAMMSDPNFLRQLKEMDVDSITTKQVNAVKGMQVYYLFLLHLHEIMEGLYFHFILSVCVCLSVCPALLVNKIPAEWMHRFGRGFR